LFVFQLPAVLLLVSDCRKNARGENADHLVWFGAFEIGIQQFVLACFWIVGILMMGAFHS